MSRKDLLKSCSEGNHSWQPLVDIETRSSAWAWHCIVCHKVEKTKPPGIPGYISMRVLEAMVDSSLRVADEVIADDHSVKGDLWTMRNAHWRYIPFEVQILYHVFGGDPFVVLFRYYRLGRGLLGDV